MSGVPIGLTSFVQGNMPKAGGNPSGAPDITTLLSMLAGTGLIGGLISGFSSGDQEKELRNLIDTLKGTTGQNISSASYTKEEINSLIEQLKQMYTGAADVAAGRIGSVLAEGNPNVPKGQPFNSMYTQELAPVIASGQEKSAEATKWGAEFSANVDNQAKTRALTIQQLLAGLAGGLPNMGKIEKGFATGLNFMNLGATGIGNLSKLWFNK